MEEIKKLLESGFDGEAQANRRYLFFAHRAEEEINFTGAPQVTAVLKEAAKVMREIAEQENMHAYAYLKASEGIGDTVENLQVALEAEEKDTKFYLLAASAARIDGQEGIAQTFERIAAVEKHHAEILRDIIQRLNDAYLTDRL